MKNMKAVLKFNLEFPDEQKAHLRCIKSTNMAIVLFDLLCNARKSIAHNHQDASEDFMQGVEVVMKHIGKLCEDNNINIDELID
jgi:hypothetical protein